MSLRCSLLGHSYGEAEIEREREEQGSEVVVTVREFEECERCGDQNVLSENKEVTALESPAPDLESAETDPDVGADPDADAASDANATPDANAGGAAGATATGVSDSTDPDVDSEDDGAEIMTDSSDGPESPGSAGTSETSAAQASADSGAETATGSAGSGSAGGASASGASADAASAEDGSGQRDEDAPSAADDDGVILDDEPDDGDDDRQPGEWPAAETTHPADAEDGEYADWPEVGQEDEGYDAEPGGESTDVEFGGGLNPESASAVDESESEEVEFVNSDGDALRSQDAGGSSPELSSGISAGAEAPSLSGPADDPDVDAEFVCPECEYREVVSGSSLRAGDICPECARGYLATE